MTAGLHTACNILYTTWVLGHTVTISHYILQSWQPSVYYNSGQLIFYLLGRCTADDTSMRVHIFSLSLYLSHTHTHTHTTILYLTLNQRPVLCNPVCWSSSIRCPPSIEWWIYNIILCWRFVLSLQDNNLNMLLHSTSTLFTCILFTYHNQRTAVHKTCKYILECNFTYYSCRI